MSENASTILPQNVQKSVLADLEQEIAERRALIQAEKQKATPDDDAIIGWKNDIHASERLRDNIFMSLDVRTPSSR